MTDRLLLGSGPSPVPRQVLGALAQPTLGHLDPVFGEVMDSCAALLRRVFGTQNPVTLPLSATGSGGMQTMVDALVRPGDVVVVGVNGLFGERMADALGRVGAEVVRVEGEWGRALPGDRVAEALPDELAAAFLVHAETSTGALNDPGGLGAAVRERGGLMLLDCVTSLGGVPVRVDDWQVDAAFSGSQKCLNCPPGLAPFTAGERALERRTGRSWYFDLDAYVDFWRPGGGGARVYHHTAPTNMIVALREALELVLDEADAEREARHRRAHLALAAALDVLGWRRLVPEAEAAWPLLSVLVPDDVDEAVLRRALLLEDSIEVSGGLGPLAGRVWRIGVMGAGARPEPQERFITVLTRHVGGDERAALDALHAGWGGA
ncbi:MAG TPA: aminotransferase class V-fold PLP-dependent enzyme [Baekduia sp.]|nr:aminotransferase class V-fold PLP-dependent enzyme [Baekduia sp.]